MIKVIEVLPGELRISSEGLFRVAIQPSAEVMGELLEVEQATAMATSFNNCNVGLEATVCPYIA
jgi:hypothetical protein